MSRDVVVLGSTGSIGTQALEIVAANPDRFSVVALTSGGSSLDVLAAQVAQFSPQLVGVADDAAVPELRQRLASLRVDSEIVAGPSANEIAAGIACDVVLNGITGSVGLAATLRALQCGSTLALANKESLVVGGALVTELAKPGQIVPVDSEHSALAQCLRSGSHDEVRRLVLTASGGPFRGMAAEEMAKVTVADALAHPTWSMGPVVTVNSATMVNKGLELIEAHLLFGIDYDSIDVVVHPQSVVHSMVEFVDGSTVAQASPPDMRLPIAMGLAWPQRVPGAAKACDWTTSSKWEFFPLDDDAFPAVGLAGAAGRLSGTAPAVFNAANEEAVAAFLAGHLAFVNIVPTVAAVLDVHCNAPAGTPVAHVADGELTVEAVLAAESWARRAAREVLAK